jgi:hypothetical protein
MTKKRLASTLGKAKIVWEMKKRRKLEIPVAHGSASPTQVPELMSKMDADPLAAVPAKVLSNASSRLVWYSSHCFPVYHKRFSEHREPACFPH